MKKLRDDKQDEFMNNYEFERFKYACKEDSYYMRISKNLILDQDTLEILSPTGKIEQEDLDILLKLEANNMVEYIK
jgi:hypothetical protein